MKSIFLLIFVILCTTHNKGQGDQRLTLQDLLNEGQYCPNFSSRGTDNREIQLISYKDKYVILDLWATWCKPCIQTLPQYEAIRKRFESNNEFIFLSISLDRDRETWLNFFVLHRLGEYHFWSGEEEESPIYRLTLSDGGEGRIMMSIPQYVIIGPSGIITRKMNDITQLRKALKQINKKNKSKA